MVYNNNRLTKKQSENFDETIIGRSKNDISIKLC